MLTFDFSPALAGWRELLAGALVTIEVTLCAMLLSCILGTLIGLARVNPARKALWLAGNTYVVLVRGTPLLVQLFILYFGLPYFGIVIPAFVCGVIGMGCYSAAYVSELVRGAILSIDRGQMEAGRSMGMSSGQAMRWVIMPQALVRMVPPMANEFIALTKNSALVSLVTIHDVMHEGQKIISVSYRSLEVYIVIAFIYLILTSATMLALRQLERKLRAGGMVQ
ncbi:MAG: amino acid ABC transporter permease [Gibbsiella quercinecans]|uniref:Amino acid ABC transporter permease n=2 Tax=Gibbsiella TaxID=929812 RepID=A0ABP7LA39_9GAMM|nr:amino acid ABC transporter permease [Gibbsiella quercinecans]ATA20793.1 ABC transporter permease [Gibbsiella quercinecans]RLM08776.1 ABC transporter permease [Gibbsiella quercinecans]RLM10421.1 ABC transporter permease [Gibbsiella quercinecans]TCT85924.1 amino acid ABC transporter membrane protein (PAAT family) [Gibbsiella quercinecans]